MKNLFWVLLLSLPIKVYSQQSNGYLQLFIYPDQCSIMINDTLLAKAKSKITLPQGTHRISIKAPKLKSISEDIIIQKDSTLVYRKILGYNDAYLAYKSEMLEYNLKKGAMITSTTLMAGLTLYLTYNFTVLSKKRQKTAYDNAMRNKFLYESSFNSSELEGYKVLFNEYKDEYYKQRNQQYFALPIAIVGTYITYKSYKFTKKIIKPKYTEPLSFNYNLFNKQFYLAYAF